MSDIEKLIGRKIYRITGFLHPADAMAFAGLAAWQRSTGILGSVMEIGVFYGRSFALMAKLVDPSCEVAIACDLFDIGIAETGESEQLKTFRSMLRFANVETSAVRIIQGDSACLRASEILEMAGRIRFLSIDGGHEEHQVRGDAELGLQVLSDDGMIVFDDFFNPMYPDVTFSIFRLLEDEMAQYAPFLITRNKLYVCRKSRVSDYRNAVGLIPLWAGAKIDHFRFRGDDVAYVYQELRNRAAYQIMASLGLGGVISGLLRASSSRFSR